MDSNEMISLLSQILDEKIGMVTAYAYAKSKGYSGSADDFANDMANIGVNISAIETAINTFNDQTVPNAETAITTAGSNQVTAVNTAGQEQLQNVTAEGGRQVELVGYAGSAQIERVNAAGASQVENVNTAGTTQVTNINNEGEAQITAIQTKGEQTRATIPADYTALSNDVTDLRANLGYVSRLNVSNTIDDIVALSAINPELFANRIGYDIDNSVQHGLTINQYGNGLININGTSSEGGIVQVTDKFTLKAGTYTVVGIGTTGYIGRPFYIYQGTSAKSAGIYITNGDTATTVTINNDITDAYIGLALNRAGLNFVNYNTRILLVKGTYTTADIFHTSKLNTAILSPTVDAVIKHPFDFSQYMQTQREASNRWWMNDYEYPAGYVRHIKTYIWGDTDQTVQVAIIKASTGENGKTLLYKTSAVGHGYVTIPIGLYVNESFWVSIKAASGLAYYQYIIGSDGLHFANNATMWDKRTGDFSKFSWQPTATTGDTYVIACEVEYASIADVTDAPQELVQTRNKMIAIGDSQTAGYPYQNDSYLDGLHWYRAVERKLGFVADSAGQYGSGYYYKPSGSDNNAMYITDNADISNYDLAVYAFGTNDYGNDVPLGTINDLYPANETFAGAVNYVISKVYEKNPTIILVLATPINRSDKGTANSNYAMDTANNAGNTLRDYCDMMIAICEKRGVMYVDRRTSPFNTGTLTSLLGDNLHPNVNGYKVMGEEMAAKIGALIGTYIEF